MSKLDWDKLKKLKKSAKELSEEKLILPGHKKRTELRKLGLWKDLSPEQVKKFKAERLIRLKEEFYAKRSSKLGIVK